jgi:hypothetical protein
MWRNYALFTLLLMFVKLVLLFTFCIPFFKTFWADFLKLAWNFAFFDTFFDFLKKKNFFGHISTLFNLWSQTRKKRRQNQKTLSKCDLDLNFTPIKGSVFSIFQKKVRFVVPYCTCHVVVYVQGMAFLHSLDRQLPRLYLNSKHIMVSFFSIK